MLLCVDCGNTNTVFSLWDGAQFLCTLRTATEHQRTADQYYVWYSTLMDHYGLKPKIDAVIISSTVPRVVFNLRVLCDRYFDCRPLVVGSHRAHRNCDVNKQCNAEAYSPPPSLPGAPNCMHLSSLENCKGTGN